MRRCPHCDREAEESARFCPACGGAFGSWVPTELREESPTSDHPASHQASPRSAVLSEGSRFLPGTTLASRYRIIGPLGKGGMGEVYRADDLKLGQAVALKFLPEKLERDPDRLARFLHEVRITRQISHPGVCRVYDAGEVGGIHFLSMEYIDGEDLASLLRRIGRLPQDKAVQIARQLCAGLAAAHELGVLHRDLKPANVMIDGRGRARITDFGIASVAAEVAADEVRIGTPAYMAPEQLAGRSVSVRSDLYALGLVLYELFTGKPAFAARTVQELQRLQSETTPTSPSSVVQGIDPAVERVILRCLEADPANRPPSALAVAAALPGGDPLAAALAAGETPSPEMVAAAGEEGALRPPAAWALLAGLLALIGVAAVLGARGTLTTHARLPKPRDVLIERSREILARLGPDAPVVDQAHQFFIHLEYLQYLETIDDSPRRWDRLATDREVAIGFWYRQSPASMVARPGFAVIKIDDPPMTAPGEAAVWLDAAGRLVRLRAIPPPARPEDADPTPSPPWSVLFEEAGMDATRFQPVAPVGTPAEFADARAAWLGTFEDLPGIPVRAEAAALAGRIVHFRLFGPWDDPAGAAVIRAGDAGFWRRFAEGAQVAIFAGLLVVAILLARRNLRLGRGDRSGATKIALIFLTIHVVVWLFWADHVSDLQREWFDIFQKDTGHSLFLAATVWLYYLGLEPFVRRRWPDTIISWNRLLAGRFRDARIGRDILVGGLFGLTGVSLMDVAIALPGWLGRAPARPSGFEPSNLMGARMLLPGILDTPLHAVLNAMQALFLLLLLRTLLRSAWVAVPLFVVVFTPVAFGDLPDPMLTLPIGMLVLTILALLLIRFGLVAGIAGMTFVDLRNNMILTVDPTVWFAASSILCVVVLAVVAMFAFKASLGGRPAFGRVLDDAPQPDRAAA